jgi:hypothetical protein
MFDREARKLLWLERKNRISIWKNIVKSCHWPFSLNALVPNVTTGALPKVGRVQSEIGMDASCG